MCNSLYMKSLNAYEGMTQRASTGSLSEGRLYIGFSERSLSFVSSRAGSFEFQGNWLVSREGVSSLFESLKNKIRAFVERAQDFFESQRDSRIRRIIQECDKTL